MALDSERIRHVLETNFGRIKTIEGFAKALGVSSRTLRRHFATEVHGSLRRYIARIRVEQAKKLLLSSSLSCKEICYLVGYSSQCVGARLFKRLTGIPMEEFRGRNQPGTITTPDGRPMSAHWKLK
jgi:transcriptional regulator GlxA family with amidase domain